MFVILIIPSLAICIIQVQDVKHEYYISFKAAFSEGLATTKNDIIR